MTERRGRLIAFSPVSYQEGFKYPESFIKAVKKEFPLEDDNPLLEILYEALETGDIIVGRFLDDRNSKLYKKWCKIDDKAPKRPTGNQGFADGFLVR